MTQRWRSLFLAGVVSVLLFLINGLAAGAAYAIKTPFAPLITGGGNSVHVTAVQSWDNKIIVVGDFNTVNGSTTLDGDVALNNLARINPDGTLDTSFSIAATNGSIFSMLILPDRRILIGGNFDTVSDQAGTYGIVGLALLDENGNVDTTFAPQVASGGVNTLALQTIDDNGSMLSKILVGGYFSEVDGSANYYFTRIDLDGVNHGHADWAFVNNLPWISSGAVNTVTIQNDKILIGGNFFINEASVVNYLARLNSDGTWDQSFIDPLLDSQVLDMKMQGNKILIAGDFTQSGTTEPPTFLGRLARLTAAGEIDGTFSNPNIDDSVFAILVQGDGKLIAGGSFLNTGMSPAPHKGIIRFDANGNPDTSFTAGVYADTSPSVRGMSQLQDGCVIIGGEFANVNGFMRSNIARLETNGSVYVADFNPIIESSVGNPRVYAIATQPDRAIVIGGLFSKVNGLTRTALARLSTEGALDMTFAAVEISYTQTTSTPAVHAIAVQDNGAILFGGTFDTVGGVYSSTRRRNLARLASGGTIDTSFTGYTNAGVMAIAIDPNNNILVGGSFTQVNGVTRNRVARMSRSGAIHVFNPNANNLVNTIALQNDGNVLLGGSFTTVGGVARTNLARVMYTDGALDTSFAGQTNGAVNAISVQPDGKVFISGAFTVPAKQIARLWPQDGSLDGTFTPVNKGNGTISSMALQADGTIFGSGYLETTTGTVFHIARLGYDGALDTGNRPVVTGGTSNVFGLALQTDGSLLAGGDFTAVDGVTRTSLVRVAATYPAAQNLYVSKDGTTISWIRGDSSPQIIRSTFEYSINNADWSLIGQGSWYLNESLWLLNQLSGLPHGQSFYIRARGTVAQGKSNGSSGYVEQVGTFCLPPLPPAIQQASGQDRLAFTANWSASATATGYLIDIATDPRFIDGTLVGSYQMANAGAGTSYIANSSLTPGTRYYYRMYAVNVCGASDPSDRSEELYTKARLTVTFAETGNGTVMSEPAGINCNSANVSSCSYDFDGHINVALSAIPDWKTAAGVFSGSCIGSATCSAVTVGGDLVSTLLFAAAPNVRVNYSSTPYGSITAAITQFKNVEKDSGDIWLLRYPTVLFQEDNQQVVFDAPYDIRLTGGMQPGFSGQTPGDYSLIKGKMLIRAGKVIVNGIKLYP